MTIRLLALVLFLAAASAARAQDCSDFPGGVLDGFAGTVAPSQLQIDRNCTIRNYPASNPLRTNFSFLTQPGQTDERWLIIFDNVVHTGQMACNSVAGHKIWFVNGSSSAIQEGCQNLLVAVEKIDKRNPAGQTTVAVGVPFTYTLTIPVLFDPATGSVIDSSGSINDLHSVRITDDLDETGVDLTYLSHVVYARGSRAPIPHTFSNAGGLLTFDDIPVILAGEQIVIEITVVLDNTPANAPGTQFVNTARWQFGRLVDGVFQEPLPGERGVTPPLTIAGPELVVTKTGPATLGRTLNLGEWGRFHVDVQNTGLGDAWNTTVLDRLPDGATGGMCDTTPEVLSARVFAADGVTPVSGPLVEGTHYSLRYDAAPTCELTLTLRAAAGPIGPGERLIVSYRSKLDPDTRDGVQLTNVAGATRWFNADGSNPDRVRFTRTLTDGTPGVLDHEDAHTVTAALFGFFFEKSVGNLTTGVSPTATAAPGDTLRYTLRLQATDVPLDGLAISDELDRLNAPAAFQAGTLRLATVPAGADTSNTSSTGGAKGTGVLDIRNLSVPARSEILVEFDITLDPTLTQGTVVLNQSALINTVEIARSDDPSINGQADPGVTGDEDPTRVVIETEPVGPLRKENTQATASVGEAFRYRITVPETPFPFPIHDVKIIDDLSASAADLRFLGVTRIAGSGAWTPVNTGSATSLVIEDTATGIDIPAGEQIVVEIEVVLEDTPTNASGLQFTNTASFLYNWVDGDDTSELPGEPGTTGPMTIVGSDVLTLEKRGPATLAIGPPGTFTLDVHNAGDGPAWNATLTDRLPDGVFGGTCDSAPTGVGARVFEADRVTPVSAPLVEGTDFSVRFSGAPDCELGLTVLSPAGTIGADQRLIVTYRAQLDADSQNGATLTNVAGVTEWFSAGGSNPETAGDRRVHRRALTDGTVGVLDHEDAHTVTVALAALLFEKTVINLTRGADPAATATPGDRLRYRLRLESSNDIPLGDLRISDELDRLNDPAAFQAGTLQLVTVPAGADASHTSGTGGAKGTGVLDIRNLSLSGPDESLLIEFEVQLAPVIADGTAVANQSQLLFDDVPFAQSDDPNVNGAADPFVAGDEDPTRVSIESAPAFRVEKVSAYPTGDPGVLLAGERLRYTITVQNAGTDDATGVVLRDDVPVNTAYVSGSTTLNGAPVADGPSGASPLGNGIPIHAPGDPTPGVVRADPSGTGSHVATVVFDVIVDPDVIDGTVISNQAFVSVGDGSVPEQPSDDPRTPIPDDPTRDVVGNAPLLFAPKLVDLQVDRGTPGIVDPGDVLHYTITIHNSGGIPASGVVLTDAVPANTTYVADSTTLNGEPVGRPDGGVSPLAAGVPIASTDRTPPLPGPGEGGIGPGESAVLEFDLRVNAGVPGGTIISNQAVVQSEELPDLPTDGDGDPATGPEPTVVVVGDGQQLSITKQVAVVGGGPALAGSTLEYVVRAVNIAGVPAFSVVITDDLDVPAAGQLAYVAQSATLNGGTAGIRVSGSLITADHSTPHGPLQPGESAVLRFRARIDANLATGTTVTNTGVVTWNTPPQTASASVSVDVGGTPGFGVLNGAVWHDADFDDARDGTERMLEGWSVELRRNGQPVQSARTGAGGGYRISGLPPNDASGDAYELRFRAPGASANTAALGRAASAFTNDLQQISDIVVPSGGNLRDLDLPIDPNGVVYGALSRTPVAGATLSLLDGSGTAPLPSRCFDDPAQQGQVTLADGYYKFDLNFSDPACPSGGSYVIAIAPPGSGFAAGYSQIIPPTSDPSTAPLSIPGCPGTADDAVPATPGHCEAQPSELAPPGSVRARTAGTTYHVHLSLDGGRVPGSSQIFNNHIPLDPILDSALAITKTTPAVNVSRGQLVPYEITIRNRLGQTLRDLSVVDRFPAGFRYVEGSARMDGVPVEPKRRGRELVWDGLGVGISAHRSIRLLMAVGAGVSDGEYVNHAQALSAPGGAALSGEVTATVRVVPDPTFDCTDVIGKVFDDANRNGVQDAGEGGLRGVRLATARGLIATTDAHGRFHIGCAVTPREGRGSNFILKLDDRTLPSGYRMSTRRTQVKRVTRGKALRFHFAASIHRVVSLDLADPVFEPGSTEIRRQWRPRLDLLLGELQKAPATLRLSYVADVEDAGLVERRLDAVKTQIKEAWRARGSSYPLAIEPEVFWRRGGPPERPAARPEDE